MQTKAAEMNSNSRKLTEIISTIQRRRLGAVFVSYVLSDLENLVFMIRLTFFRQELAHLFESIVKYQREAIVEGHKYSSLSLRRRSFTFNARLC